MNPFRRPAAALVLLLCCHGAPRADEPGPGDPVPKSVRGQLVESRPAEKRFALKTKDGRRLDFQLDPASRVRDDGKPAELSQFKEGTAVRVSYEPRGDKNRVVELSRSSASAADVTREVNDALRSIKDYSFQNRDEYERRLQAALSQVDDQVEDLRERAAGASGEAKERLQQAAQDLQARSRVVRERLQRVRASSAPAWQELRSGVNSAFEELRDAFDRAASHFK